MSKLKDLPYYTGTENYYRTSISNEIVYTDGVKYVADEAGAYWLIDAIVSHQLYRRVRREHFQVWKLQVFPHPQNPKSNAAYLTCTDGDDNQVTRQFVEYTDFPLKSITMFLTNNVIMLPSEY